MRYLLNGKDWELMGHWPYTPLYGTSMETGGELQGVTTWINATVPGTVQNDLLNAGLIPDPYFAQNSLLSEWVEHRWWRYKKTFTVPEDARTERVTVEFLGVDYSAYFFLNGKKLGWHEGMFDPIVYDVSGRLNSHNRLEVVIESVPQEHSQIGYTSETNTQKARFAYKWDFCTRMVHVGIWDDVLLNCTGPYRLHDVFISSDVDEHDHGLIRVSGCVDGYNGSPRGKVLVFLNEECTVIKADPHTGIFSHEFVIQEPDLWQVNGLGSQPLYMVRIEAHDEKGLSDEWRGRIGIRSIRYLQNERAPYGALPYTIAINGSPVYIKGVNMTPLSHMYGTLCKEDYRRILLHAKNIGVTLIRVWGGGLIEKSCFYELCDEMGILVWQEFIQSSSGIDNIPSKKPKFLKLLEIAARAALKTRRNYTCHAVWSGGNELMDASDKPVKYGDENISMLAKLCKKYDPDKLFLPTSASGPTSWQIMDVEDICHDIHGNWKYEGIPQHYYRYNHADNLLHSEFGCDGLSSIEGLMRILPKEDLFPTDMNRNLVWRHHGEWWDCYARDTDLFGELTNLNRWVMLSQFIQAEAVRYILESNRRRKFRNSGSIIWQLNEPWPNVSCTSLLEFNGTAKMVAYWAKKAFSPVSLSARYNTLIFPHHKEIDLQFFLHNSLEDSEYSVRASLYDLNGTLLSQTSSTVHAHKNRVTDAGFLHVLLPEVKLGLIIAELLIYDTKDGEIFQNHIIFSQREETPFASMQMLPQTTLEATINNRFLCIKNTGTVASIFVHPINGNPNAVLLLEDSYFLLMPGEKRTIEILDTSSKVHPMAVRSLNSPQIQL